MSFFEELKSDNEVSMALAANVKGLNLFFDFISPTEEQELLDAIKKQPWITELKRRVQHYGYKYDYKARSIDPSFYVGPLPKWLHSVQTRIVEKGIISFLPDQAIINEYEPGQGIAAHIDCEPCFGDTIISLSMGSDCIMNFESPAPDNRKIEILLPQRSLVVLTGESRYKWSHGIAQRVSDEFNGKKRRRNRRVSITFRKVIVN